ncbi:MAG: YbfB/YjiJ family MFS transporter [Gammaproteobacteria bacterium]|nr:YbfB/YjiJ family MFS transporter [Gammaproteobacteria bacterium]MCP5136482.1 YbfB/YjiJ family MFS transporter [Gammaproteobacteria bacterium]
MNQDSQRIIWGGISALVLTVGIARFAYTPLLPIMQAGVPGFSDADGGLLAAGNYIGYLSGAALAAHLHDIHLKDRLFRWGLVLALLTGTGMALTVNPWLWAVLRFFAGLSASAGLVLCSGLVMHALLRHGDRPRMGLYFGGVGIGLAVAAIAVAIQSAWLDWREQWLALSVLGMPLAWLAHRWVPSPPRAIDAKPPQSGAANSPKADPNRRRIRLLQAAYFCAGFGFVVSATFLVDMLTSTPALQPIAPWAWVLVGLAAAPSCLFWERIGARIGEVNALIRAWLAQIAGILMTLPGHDAPVVLLGAFLFGFTFMGIVALVLTMVGHLYPANPARPMGRLTLSFGFAQVIGPAIAGVMAEYSGSYAGPMLLATGVLSVGLFPLLWLRNPGTGQ